MKKRLCLFFAFIFSTSLQAAPAVQRTLDSSFSDYQKYLLQNNRSSFVDSYIQVSSVMELQTPSLEKCLEQVYLGASSADICLSAVKSLAARPLNSARREILFSFLSKLSKLKSAHKSFYTELRAGLLKTHPMLSRSFGVPEVADGDADSSQVQDLEMKAWKKAAQKKFLLEEVALLINGKRISNLAKWNAPKGVYQWSLVSNTHEPLVRLGTFSQFAAESLKDLKPFAAVTCQDLPELEIQKYGLMQMEVYANSKCVVSSSLSSSPSSPHLGNSVEMVKIQNSSSRHWVWPVLAVVAVGMAASLKNKQVSVQWPGAH